MPSSDEREMEEASSQDYLGAYDDTERGMVEKMKRMAAKRKQKEKN